MSTNEIHHLSSYPFSPKWPPGNDKKELLQKYNFVLIACARWETAYISEWASYHRSIGVDHIYLYCNDDDPTSLYEATLPFSSGKNPFITFIHYPFPGLQFQMYFHFARNFIHESKWIMFLDIDEFIFIPVEKNIPQFFLRFPPDMDALYINWVSFGNNYFKSRPPGSVLLNYTRREATATPYTKVFIKSERFPYREIFLRKNYAIMHDYAQLDNNLKCYSVLGHRIYNYYENFPHNAWDFLNTDNRKFDILEIAFIAHYNIKSEADFDFRVKRGLHGDYAAEKIWGDMDTNTRKNHLQRTNEIEDLRLNKYWYTYLTNEAWKTSPFPKPDYPLISNNSQTTQSSTAHPWSIEEDSKNLLNRRPCGAAQAHTALELDPWWKIDLGSPKNIHEIRLFNRLDGVLERMSFFSFLCSNNDIEWEEFYRKDNPDIFGGIDGSPFIWKSLLGINARWIKIMVHSEYPTYLNLDQVEIFGL